MGGEGVSSQKQLDLRSERASPFNLVFRPNIAVHFGFCPLLW